MGANGPQQYPWALESDQSPRGMGGGSTGQAGGFFSGIPQDYKDYFEPMINQQQDRISGLWEGQETDWPGRIKQSTDVEGYKGPGNAPEYSQFYQPTMDQMLQSGAPIDTAGMEQAARSQAERQWRDMSQAINAQMVSGGKIGSSAQTGRLSQAGGDISTQLGERIAMMRGAAEESAASRRMEAMRGQREQTGLEDSMMQWRDGARNQARQAQTGAGQDFINSLISASGMFMGGSSGGYSGGGAPPRSSGQGGYQGCGTSGGLGAGRPSNIQLMEQMGNRAAGRNPDPSGAFGPVSGLANAGQMNPQILKMGLG